MALNKAKDQITVPSCKLLFNKATWRSSSAHPLKATGQTLQKSDSLTLYWVCTARFWYWGATEVASV